MGPNTATNTTDNTTTNANTTPPAAGTQTTQRSTAGPSHKGRGLRRRVNGVHRTRAHSATTEAAAEPPAHPAEGHERPLGATHPADR